MSSGGSFLEICMFCSIGFPAFRYTSRSPTFSVVRRFHSPVECSLKKDLISCKYCCQKDYFEVMDRTIHSHNFYLAIILQWHCLAARLNGAKDNTIQSWTNIAVMLLDRMKSWHPYYAYLTFISSIFFLFLCTSGRLHGICLYIVLELWTVICFWSETKSE